MYHRMRTERFTDGSPISWRKFIIYKRSVTQVTDLLFLTVLLGSKMPVKAYRILRKNGMSMEKCRQFRQCLSELEEMVLEDMASAYARDPAATGYPEIALCYPGLYAVTVQRIAHILYTMDMTLFARSMTEYAHSCTGIDIHPGATIDSGFFIDHGTGVVIGETTVIGKNVTLYQGVTLGGISPAHGQALQNKKRHPNIGDGVTIYANATILGGNTVIGENSIVGANAFVTASVPPGITVKGVWARSDG